MEDFKWVLTVPAMWKARGKQLMREAAYKVYITNCQSYEPGMARMSSVSNVQHE